MRNMSFMLTKKQIYDETKDVTRRLGWPAKRLPAGSMVMASEKCQGLEKGAVHCTAFEKVRKYPNPYIIRNGSKIFFDAVFPVRYADGKRSARAEGYHLDTGNTTIIPEIEYFIVTQLWPKKCYPCEEYAMQALHHPPQSMELY